jgi:hypothetical protein
MNEKTKKDQFSEFCFLSPILMTLQFKDPMWILMKRCFSKFILFFNTKTMNNHVSDAGSFSFVCLYHGAYTLWILDFFFFFFFKYILFKPEELIAMKYDIWFKYLNSNFTIISWKFYI